MNSNETKYNEIKLIYRLANLLIRQKSLYYDWRTVNFEPVSQQLDKVNQILVPLIWIARSEGSHVIYLRLHRQLKYPSGILKNYLTIINYESYLKQFIILDGMLL